VEKCGILLERWLKAFNPEFFLRRYGLRRALGKHHGEK
jgi:hypothetical protein